MYVVELVIGESLYGVFCVVDCGDFYVFVDYEVCFFCCLCCVEVYFVVLCEDELDVVVCWFEYGFEDVFVFFCWLVCGLCVEFGEWGVVEFFVEFGVLFVDDVYVCGVF